MTVSRSTIAATCGLLLGLVLLWGGAAAQAAAGPDDRLWSRLHRIEAAFRDGDAAALRPSFSSSGKLRVDLREVAGSPALYAPGQLQIIFEGIFAECLTREFAFRAQDVTRSSPETAFARVSWVRRAGAGAREVSGNLTFTLREEGGDWRIHEILSTR